MDNVLQFLDQDYSGYASMQQEGMEMLVKALTAGAGVDAAAFTGGRAMIPESLDQTLVNILHTQDEARLFQRLKKKPVRSPVHQWNVRDEVGEDDGAWVPEGGLSIEADQNIFRQFETAKYLQTLRRVTLQASISNMLENAMVLEQNAGTLWLIRNVEKKLFTGDDTLVAEEINGLNRQIPAGNVLDVRGATANSATFETRFNEGARMIRENYGRASLFLSSPMVMQDVQGLIRDRIIFRGGGNVGGGSGIFDSYPTPFGNIEILDDVFVEARGIPRPSTLVAQRPGAGAITASARAPAANSEFAGGDAGNYRYRVVFTNRWGDSVASAEENVAAVVAGDGVTLECTPDGAGPEPTAIKVYRSIVNAAGGAEVRHAFTVPYTEAFPAAQDVVDLNSFLPGTIDGYMLTMGAAYDAIEWFQFLPMMKFDLYPTNAAVYPFLMLLFGSLALKKPVQHARIKNISPSDLNWF